MVGVIRSTLVKQLEHTDGKYPNLAISEHTSIIGHKYTLADVKVLVKEDRDLMRKMREIISSTKTNQP